MMAVMMLFGGMHLMQGMHLYGGNQPPDVPFQQ
jgi:hypothetical protein